VGSRGGFSRASLTPTIIVERLLEYRTFWHQWDDFATVPDLSSYIWKGIKGEKIEQTSIHIFYGELRMDQKKVIYE
jgi:hypothetical protein